MLKISGYLVMTGSILCALQAATGPPAAALDRWIEFTNNTRMVIAEIYISRAGAQIWNVDLLGPDLLAPASSVQVNIDDGAGCRFDLKTVFDDGTIQVLRNVNVCAAERYAISHR
jgi:serine protease Do